MTRLECDPDELVRLLRAGDLEALAAVTTCFGERMRAEARRTCRSEAEAEDAVQDAALAAWRYGPGFRGEGRVERWLVRLVATACNRLRRGLKNDQALHLTDVELMADEDGPELLAARAELAERLAEALSALSPRDQAILMLADGEGWRSAEIAAELSMTPGAVRTRLSRAHRRLKRALEADLVNPSSC